MPELMVMPAAVGRRVAIVAVDWVGMRLRIHVEGGDGLTADVRVGPDGEGESVVDRPRELDADGRTSLLVPDDMLIGRPGFLELRDGNGRVVAGRATVIGG